ncbi:MAG: DUF1552 domain-containing protein [Myxococcota bacterium]
MTTRKTKPFSRRHFLYGAGGAALALPALELTHGEGLAQLETDPMLFVVHNHGGTVSARTARGTLHDGSGGHHAENFWWADGPGTLRADALGPIHRGLLDPFVAKATVFKGITNQAAYRNAPHRGGHRWSNVSHNTCAQVHQSGEDNPRVRDPSFDELIAIATEDVSAFRTIDLELQSQHYGSPFKTSSGATRSSESDARRAFDNLFGHLDDSADDALLAEGRRRQRVLDGVRESFARLRQRAGVADRAILDAHAEHINSIERSVERLANASACSAPEINLSAEGYIARGEVLVDIMIAAARCRLSRVFTYQIGDLMLPGGSFDQPRGHSLGHRARDTTGGRRSEWLNIMEENRRARFSLFTRLLAGLEATPVGDGTLLDSSLAVYSSEFSNAAAHSVVDLPILTAGSAGGTLPTGQSLAYEPEGGDEISNASTHNLYTSLLQAFGLDVEHFGDDSCSYRGVLRGYEPS